MRVLQLATKYWLLWLTTIVQKEISAIFATLKMKKGSLSCLILVHDSKKQADLTAVVHAKFNWVWCLTDFCNFFHLQADVSINPVVSKYATFS
jgi:hypothetical protein